MPNSDTQSPSADASSVPVRVVVKISEKSVQPGSGPQSNKIADTLAELRRFMPDVELKRYFSSAERLRAADQPPFNRYFAVQTPDRQSAAALVERLNSSPLVEIAYVEGGSVPPPVNPTDDPRSVNQGYLGPAPVGIDAAWAWSITDGSGVLFVDLEHGWTLDHEDLVDAGITIISGISKDSFGHGTAVLGEVVAVDNSKGGVGIAP